jgi:hypothetical protein
MTEHQKIAKEIKQILNVDVFERKRTLKNVDARSLYCHILKLEFNYTLHQIKDTFLENNMKYDHSSVYYAICLYPEVSERRPDIAKAKEVILSKNNPKYKLLKRIEQIDNIEILNNINLCIDTYDND